MKTLRVFILVVNVTLLATSCRDTQLQPQVPPDYSGLYSDTFTFSHPTAVTLNVIDTVIGKRLYKINDSTYRMQHFTCLDTASLTGCGLFPVYISMAGSVYEFQIRADNTLRFHEYASAPLLPYNTGFFASPDYFYIKTLHSGRTEIHKMRKR
jgi:hypothetical protein